jgi:hypothetical protein
MSVAHDLDEVLEHILRPTFPWREPTLTECGREVAKCREVISRNQALAKFKRLGKIRAAMSTCVTCWQTTEWNREWDESPSEVMGREAKTGGPFYARHRGEGTRLDGELRAIAALVAEHRDEFDAYIEGLGETADLAARRRERRRGQR